jgi:hypothetical protein
MQLPPSGTVYVSSGEKCVSYLKSTAIYPQKFTGPIAYQYVFRGMY